MKHLSLFISDQFSNMPTHLTLKSELSGMVTLDKDLNPPPGPKGEYHLKIAQHLPDENGETINSGAPVIAMTFSARGSGKNHLWTPTSLRYPRAGSDMQLYQKERHGISLNEQSMKRCLEMRKIWDLHLRSQNFYKTSAIEKIEGAEIKNGEDTTDSPEVKIQNL